MKRKLILALFTAAFVMTSLSLPAFAATVNAENEAPTEAASPTEEEAPTEEALEKNELL